MLKIQDLPTQSSPRKRAAILVLGVHRSGTSSLAHLLNVLGAALPEEVMGPACGNPLGHWEPMRLAEINEEILSAIGRSWHDPRPIAPSWFRSKEAYAFHERLVAEITSGYGVAPLILIKEPRICRLAPLYLDVLDVLAIEPLVILPIRHPGEVVRSIHERDNIDPRTIEHLWLRSILEAEEASRGCVRVWTSFECLLDSWEITAESISRGLGITWPNELGKVSEEAATILRPRHRHFNITDYPAPVPLGPLTIRAWQAAQQGLNGDETGARILFDEIRTPINEIDRLSFPVQEWIERQLSKVGNLEAAHRDAVALTGEAEERAERQLSRVKELETVENAHRDAIARLTGEAEERAERQLSRVREFETVETAHCDAIARLSSEVEESKAQISLLQGELSKLQTVLTERSNEAERLRRQVDSIQASICWRLTWPVRWLHGQFARPKRV
jgi:hypothetical protein